MKGGAGYRSCPYQGHYNYCINNEHVVLDSKDFINRDSHILLWVYNKSPCIAPTRLTFEPHYRQKLRSFHVSDLTGMPHVKLLTKTFGSFQIWSYHMIKILSLQLNKALPCKVKPLML